MTWARPIIQKEPELRLRWEPAVSIHRPASFQLRVVSRGSGSGRVGKGQSGRPSEQGEDSGLPIHRTLPVPSMAPST